jgi:hypothetical protein
MRFEESHPIPKPGFSPVSRQASRFPGNRFNQAKYGLPSIKVIFNLKTNLNLARPKRPRSGFWPSRERNESV